jgi:hypothetical protein
LLGKKRNNRWMLIFVSQFIPACKRRLPKLI